jgi:hypothetical protein
VNGPQIVSLADEEGVKQILVRTVFGLCREDHAKWLRAQQNSTAHPGEPGPAREAKLERTPDARWAWKSNPLVCSSVIALRMQPVSGTRRYAPWTGSVLVSGPEEGGLFVSCCHR